MTKEKIPYTTNHAEVGDIITSPAFVYCIAAYGTVWSGKKQRNMPLIDRLDLTVDGYQSDDHNFNFVAYYTRKGDPITETVNIGIFDESRGRAKFVVEETRELPGGDGRETLSGYPGQWQINARRFTEDGNYNPEGERINFFQTKYTDHTVEEVEVVGKMKKTINFTKND